MSMRAAQGWRQFRIGFASRCKGAIPLSCVQCAVPQSEFENNPAVNVLKSKFGYLQHTFRGRMMISCSAPAASSLNNTCRDVDCNSTESKQAEKQSSKAASMLYNVTHIEAPPRTGSASIAAVLTDP